LSLAYAAGFIDPPPRQVKEDEPMSSSVASSPVGQTDFERLKVAREVIRAEAEALAQLANRLDDRFCRAVELIANCRGAVVVSGMGKAGLIGQKTVATLASTGTPAHFLHPAEAIHGDLGRVRSGDVALILSQSGETEEVVRLLPSLAEMGVTIIAITARPESTLGSAAAVVLELGNLREACSLGLAPSSSTTAMIALGDALALVLSQMRGFAAEDFARFHPGGSLGRKLAKVEEAMRPLAECRVAPETDTVREVFLEVHRPGRRTGAIMLVDPQGCLTGLFTDSDLARLFEVADDGSFDQPIRNVMTAAPISVTRGTRLPDAVKLLADRKISELPVVDEDRRPLGLIDITDLIDLAPAASAASTPTKSTRFTQNDHRGARKNPPTIPIANHRAG
jgi:arabinose-5-phosphate isomerase